MSSSASDVAEKHYYAIDIDSINSPKYLYTYPPTNDSTYDASKDGQSWKQPQFTTVVKSGGTATDVFLLTGGYDEHYDDADSVDTGIGASILFVNATSGSKIQEFNSSTISTMTKSIVSAYATDTVDDGKDITNQIYAGDMEGQYFGFRDNDDPDYPNELDGSWQSVHVFSATSSGKKIFEESDYVREYMYYYDTTENDWLSVVGDYIFFGTGDRAHPLRTDATNYFYCVKNDWRTQNITVDKTVSNFSTLGTDDSSEPVMLDVTDDLIQGGTAAQKEAVEEALNKKYNRGWYIKLEGTGEKCLSTPVVYNGVVYFTTYTPPSDAAAANLDPCDTSAGSGTAKLYAVDYQTGAAVFNFYAGNDNPGTGAKVYEKEDRSLILDQDSVTIASNPVLIITEKMDKLATGYGTQNVTSPKNGLNTFYWTKD